MVLPMPSDKNIRSLSFPTINTLSQLEKKNSFTEIIALASMNTIPNKSISPKPAHISINLHGHRNSFRGKQTYSIESTMADMSYRLTIRKTLQNRLAIVSDIMCFLAVLGIILMITANELTFNRINDNGTKISWFSKLIITITTVFLLMLLIYYHYLDLKLYSNQNSLQDNRVGLTDRKIFLIILEFIICAIHPIPLSYPSTDPPYLNPSLTNNSYPLSYISIDVALGLPMFLRLYLFGRTIMFHSRLVRNASLRSFGYLNRVAVDFFFVIKTCVEQWPGRCLLAFCTIVFFIGSWCLRACDYKSTNEHLSMGDSMWVFMVTFSTIGYGDIVPSTHCGRAIATIIGLIGILVSALLIAVLAQKLLLTRKEKYVHTFVLNTNLAKKRQFYAANVIKYAVKAWFIKRHHSPRSIQFMKAQRQLFRSIYHLQQVRQEQKILIDNCVGLHELMSLQQNINTQYDESVHQMTEMKNKMQKIEHKLNIMTDNMDSLQISLNALLDNLRK